MISDVKKSRLIGLARRAGKVSYGIEGVLNDIKKHKAKLIIISDDISPRTKKQITDISEKLPIISLSATKDELGKIIGTKPTVVLSINDSNFKKGILEVNQFD